MKDKQSVYIVYYIPLWVDIFVQFHPFWTQLHKITNSTVITSLLFYLRFNTLVISGELQYFDPHGILTGVSLLQWVYCFAMLFVWHLALVFIHFCPCSLKNPTNNNNKQTNKLETWFTLRLSGDTIRRICFTMTKWQHFNMLKQHSN